VSVKTQTANASRLRRRHLRHGEVDFSRRNSASTRQRAKVAGECCLVCGRSPVDPAHLVPQRLGGCGHPDCVIGLCRTHHRLFDSGELRLEACIGPAQEVELAHALTHVGVEELAWALRHGWPAPWEEDQPEGEDG
jgi:hypothetical protein